MALWCSRFFYKKKQFLLESFFSLLVFDFIALKRFTEAKSWKSWWPGVRGLWWCCGLSRCSRSRRSPVKMEEGSQCLRLSGAASSLLRCSWRTTARRPRSTPGPMRRPRSTPGPTRRPGSKQGPMSSDQTEFSGRTSCWLCVKLDMIWTKFLLPLLLTKMMLHFSWNVVSNFYLHVFN